MTLRYTPNFRRHELKLICDCALKGQSLGFVGVAGSGKSNIVNILHVDPYEMRERYLGEMNPNVLFPLSVGNTWDGTTHSFLNSIAEALRELDADALTSLLPLDGEQSDTQLAAGIKAALKQLCQVQKQQVMLILDDIDEAVRRGPQSMWEHLLAIRNDGNRDKLSFLLFTKQPPHILGKGYGFDKLKFYDLLSGYIYALGLYNKEEIAQMLAYLNSREPMALTQHELDQIAVYCGGHAHLARLLFTLWQNEHPANDVSMAYLASRVDIERECHRILANLHPEEQSVAIRFARNQHTSYDNRVIEHLVQRGLITDAAKGFWFSPLMGEFLRTYGV